MHPSTPVDLHVGGYARPQICIQAVSTKGLSRDGGLQDDHGASSWHRKVGRAARRAGSGGWSWADRRLIRLRRRCYPHGALCSFQVGLRGKHALPVTWLVPFPVDPPSRLLYPPLRLLYYDPVHHSSLLQSPRTSLFSTISHLSHHAVAIDPSPETALAYHAIPPR